MTKNVNAITFDAADPAALAAFWAQALEATVDESRHPDVLTIGASTMTPFWVFQKADERSTGKNRVHADIFVCRGPPGPQWRVLMAGGRAARPGCYIDRAAGLQPNRDAGPQPGYHCRICAVVLRRVHQQLRDHPRRRNRP